MINFRGNTEKKMSQIATIKLGYKPLNVHLIFQRSKTHQKDETSNKRRTTKLRHKITRGKDASRKKLLVGVQKTSVKKSKTVKKHHSRHPKTPWSCGLARQFMAGISAINWRKILNLHDRLRVQSHCLHLPYRNSAFRCIVKISAKLFLN